MATAAAGFGPAAARAADTGSELRCAHFGACSGCVLQDGLAAPPLYSEAVDFFRGLGLQELPAVMKVAHGWRCRAKLAVRGPVGRPLIGLFREGSHDVVDIVGHCTAPPAGAAAATGGVGGGAEGGGGAGKGRAVRRGRGTEGKRGGGKAAWEEGAEEAACRAHHPRINQAAALIKELVTQLRIQPYNEAAPPPPPSSRAKADAHRQQHHPRFAPAAGAAATTSAAATINIQPGPSPRSSPRSSPPDSPPGGLLRYLQLTAVPSRPGGRAEEDPHAGVQVVLVVNAPPPPPAPAAAVGGSAAASASATAGGSAAVDTAAAAVATLEADPRVAPALALGRLLWRMAGPGGPMAPAPAEDAAAAAEPPLDPGLDPGLSAAVGSAGAAAPRATAAPPPPLVHSVWLNFQPDASRNAVLGPAWVHLAGPAAAWQEFGGVAACVGPGSFVQANYGAMQLVLREVAGMVPPGSRVTELHAGIGVIGLSLAARRRLAALRCVEINPEAAAPFRSSLQGLQRRLQQLGEPEPHVEYITAEAGSEPGRFLQGCDVLVVDPPRKGLGASLLNALTATQKRVGQPPPPPVGTEATEWVPQAAAGPACGGKAEEAAARGKTRGALMSPAPAAAAARAGDGTVTLSGADSAMAAASVVRQGHDGQDHDREGDATATAAAGGALTTDHGSGSGAAATTASATPSTPSSSPAATSAATAAAAAPRTPSDSDQASGGPGLLPRVLVYLSCGFRALRGDLAVLLAGGWVLRRATAYLFFPGTDSLETLVLLTREEEGVAVGRDLDNQP